MNIRFLDESELTQVSDLVRESFLQGTAPFYSSEGVRTFLGFSCSESIRERFHQGNLVAGAFEEDRLVGILELRPDFHIFMLFVAPDCQGRGVGRGLLLRGLGQFAGEDGLMPRVTVHSSPNAEGFYRTAGFETFQPERIVDGIRFIPMVFSPGDREEKV